MLLLLKKGSVARGRRSLQIDGCADVCHDLHIAVERQDARKWAAVAKGVAVIYA